VRDRCDTRKILSSESLYHESAVEDDRMALAQRTVVQVELAEIVGLLNNNNNTSLQARRRSAG
jgi:hypothetical protein